MIPSTKILRKQAKKLKLLFDLDENEYALLLKKIGGEPLANWKEVIKDYTKLVYKI